MGLTSLDIAVMLTVGGAAVLGLMRGFVTELLSLAAWVLVVVALKLFHTPVAAALAEPTGTAGGAATLAFALISGIGYFGGRMVANAVGSRTRASVLGPLDRALGFGFGALKGLILASLAFLLLLLAADFIGGGPTRRPVWIKDARSYQLLNATSASIVDFIDRRRRGEPVFGE